MLNDDDLTRYARQVIIPNFDEEGQEKLLGTKCLIVGAGGLGCPVALYASAAGFGHIEICDDDTIELTNLNRQIAHKNNKIGHNKAENLVWECSKINPNISIKSNKKNFNQSTDISNFPKTDELAPITNCREAGIIGPITGLIGSMQVNEGIKEIAFKNYQSRAGYLFLYDGLAQSLDKIKLTKNQKCLVCSI